MVESEYPGEFLRIKDEVDPRFESTSMLFELDKVGRSPVVVFEKIKGHKMPLVTNVAGSRKLLAACLGVKPADLPTAFRERCQRYIPCETVSVAAWDDVVIEGDDLHLPLGKPVKVLLRSIDVLHSFYVPEFRTKMDLVPGMVSYVWFIPTRTGTFEILCAELCGNGHFNMRSKVVVQEESEYQAWLQKQKTFAQLSARARQAKATQ